MGLKGSLAPLFAKYVLKKQKQWMREPEKFQRHTLQYLLKKAQHTAFGKDHNFSAVKSYQDFKQAVPLVDYEGLRPYVERIIQGERDVLWPGLPSYFAKTSGTTSGAKYIPLTKESVPFHINAARDALLNYIYETGNAHFLDRQMIFLSGSPVLERQGGILTGRLSGIVNHHVPGYLRRNQMPTYETNCIEAWEEKLDKVVEETLAQDMSLISGIPPWVQMYFDRIHAATGGKRIKEVFPNFEVFVYGGVNFAPYRKKVFESIGAEIPSIETYPASEGFFAFQDQQASNDLLLLANNGMFYEFVPVSELHSENPKRLSIDEVELNENYALILHTNAGLWGYQIGDTIKFVSKHPHRIRFTGRTKHFISAFGEHVIAEEVEKAMQTAQQRFPEVRTLEFTVAPQVAGGKGNSYHEWLVAFEEMPENIADFSQVLDEKLRSLNAYYDDLRRGNILKPCVLTPLRPEAFREYMKSQGKLGGQNKVPRLSDNRKIADELVKWAF